MTYTPDIPLKVTEMAREIAARLEKALHDMTDTTPLQDRLERLYETMSDPDASPDQHSSAYDEYIALLQEHDLLDANGQFTDATDIRKG